VTVYARSDVASIAISPVHGGCGKTHSRPVHNGAPVKIWELTCHKCEDHLRSDDLWASMAGKVPETPDEQVSRESSEKRSHEDLERHNAEAFSQLANAVTGNAAAMAKLVELMAMMSPSALTVETHKEPVKGEVISRANEIGTPPSAPSADPEAPTEPSETELPPEEATEPSAEPPAPEQPASSKEPEEPESESEAEAESAPRPRRGRPRTVGV
jgi:hypothetical protein